MCLRAVLVKSCRYFAVVSALVLDFYYVECVEREPLEAVPGVVKSVAILSLGGLLAVFEPECLMCSFRFCSA